MKKAVLIVNVGTPSKPDPREVRSFLSQFLNDPRVIDLPWIRRKILVNGIIIPFRVKKSTGLYRRVWTETGSPILLYLNSLQQKLELKFGADADFYAAMRYGEPSITSVLDKINSIGYDELLVLPLFPQYAESTTGSIIAHVESLLPRYDDIKTVKYIRDFHDHPAFIRAFSTRIGQYMPDTFDYVVFSYHSLPVRQVDAQHPGKSCLSCSCDKQMPDFGKSCYKAQSYETTRLIAESLGLKPEDYTVTFQSRLTRKWIGPFTEDVILQLAAEGKKRILVAAPSFVADCLETIVEIGMDYDVLFRENGGAELVMAESLNDEDNWVEAIGEMLQ